MILYLFSEKIRQTLKTNPQAAHSFYHLAQINLTLVFAMAFLVLHDTEVFQTNLKIANHLHYLRMHARSINNVFCMLNTLFFTKVTSVNLLEQISS